MSICAGQGKVKGDIYIDILDFVLRESNYNDI